LTALIIVVLLFAFLVIQKGKGVKVLSESVELLRLILLGSPAAAAAVEDMFKLYDGNSWKCSLWLSNRLFNRSE
jgi:hypothetical protein